MSSDDPTVSLKYREYEQLQTAKREAEQKNADLLKQLEAAKLADPSNTVAKFSMALNEALKIVQFAVGNLDPATVRGWPFEALQHVAQALTELPGIDPALDGAQAVWLESADIAAAFDADRRQRPRAAVFATAADFGPQTTEAAMAHGALMRSMGGTVNIAPAAEVVASVTVENGTPKS